MEGFWDIMRGWNPFGQSLFLLFVIMLFLGTITKIVYYITVSLQGWPPEYLNEEEEQEENESEE